MAETAQGPMAPGAGTTKGPMASPLPREIIKWLQSLDLSFMVKNPKRDFTNGFLVAEIVSRYFPKDINLNTFENGTRLAAKVDNWEQLFKLFKKRELPIMKQEIDAVIHCSENAATSLIFHLYQVLTNRSVKLYVPQQQPDELLSKPAFMRDTASKRLKDNDISRIEDNIERTIKAIDVLGSYHEERRARKAAEAPLLIQQHRQKGIVATRDFDVSSKDDPQDSLQMSEVRVKALSASAAALQGKGAKVLEGPRPTVNVTRAQLLKAVGAPQSSVGALAALQQPALFVKPAADIMRPLVLSIVQESEELSKVIDARKDVVVSFMEQCREGLPGSIGGAAAGGAGAGGAGGDATAQAAHGQRMREVEETSVRVFETLANRAQLLVDTLTKSPQEFWKVWSTFFPALTDFPETSPVFESAVFLFKRIGKHMSEADASLTQQLITEVGLPCLAKELARSPEKRECLCEIIYTYTQQDTLNHLLVLRSLKERLGDKTAVYIACLSFFINLDADLQLLDEHLLDLYVYYALMATQSPQPRVRVAGISILSTITTCSSQHHSIVALIPSFDALAMDEYWEVQAQLLLLSAHLLAKLSLAGRPESAGGADEGSASSKVLADPTLDQALNTDEAQEALIHIINRLFDVGASKNVLQVGLTALVHLLPVYENLLPMYVTVLLQQLPEQRKRLLQPPAAEGEYAVSRKAYVWGSSSRMYEERCVSQLWPHLDVAKTLAMQLESSKLKLQLPHLEVLLASLPEQIVDEEANEWLEGVYDKVKSEVFDALIGPDTHAMSAQFIKYFWTCPNEHVAATSAERSKKALLQALQSLYSDEEQPKVNQAAVVQFLRDMRNRGGELAVEVSSAVESFRETMPTEFNSSTLASVLR